MQKFVPLCHNCLPSSPCILYNGVIYDVNNVYCPTLIAVAVHSFAVSAKPRYQSRITQPSFSIFSRSSGGGSMLGSGGFSVDCRISSSPSWEGSRLLDWETLLFLYPYLSSFICVNSPLPTHSESVALARTNCTICRISGTGARPCTHSTEKTFLRIRTFQSAARDSDQSVV